ncbi:hypothetical protein [Nonomuraea rubra]|uniref:Uncharacterized protein n=1 Tax=Nonomuraea rubra TaxID=46180 RepID=A0A7X0NMT0_9ACTN|nr:hypothetical protein [Nonomuraea rubra]MBB6546141.1 hypothetical protein [Nonomuraea rubra]
MKISRPLANGLAVVSVAATGLLGIAVPGAASAETSRPEDPQFSNNARLVSPELRKAEQEVLNAPAPAPQPIAPEDLPLNDSERRAARSDVSIQAADVWCGSWLSNPGAVTLEAVTHYYAGEYYWDAPSPEGAQQNLTWRPIAGTVSSNSVRYGWSKMFPVDMNRISTFLFDAQITTGWWDNSGNPHFCGWGSNLARTIVGTDAAYTAGVRQSEATYIRAHGKPSYPGQAWEYLPSSQRTAF